MSTMNMDFSKLLSQIEQVTTKTYDDNSAEFWKPTKDKDGNAAAIIRFLPNKVISDFPFVRMWSHSFKHPKTQQWYIENSLTTIGEQDYIGEMNQKLWNSGDDLNKKIASARKRKLSYISNILVIKDPGNPDNNGKVFKFKYGTKIFEKIVGAAKPNQDLGEVAINAFDPMLGADFLLKMKLVEMTFNNAQAKMPNYDESKFSSQKPIASGNEDEIQKILDQCYDLNEEIAPAKFKSYDELKKRFLHVVGDTTQAPVQQKAKTSTQDFDDGDAELAKLAEQSSEKKTSKVPTPTMDDSDVDEDFFKSLIE